MNFELKTLQLSVSKVLPKYQRSTNEITKAQKFYTQQLRTAKYRNKCDTPAFSFQTNNFTVYYNEAPVYLIPVIPLGKSHLPYTPQLQPQLGMQRHSSYIQRRFVVSVDNVAGDFCHLLHEYMHALTNHASIYIYIYICRYVYPCVLVLKSITSQALFTFTDFSSRAPRSHLWLVFCGRATIPAQFYEKYHTDTYTPAYICNNNNAGM